MSHQAGGACIASGAISPGGVCNSNSPSLVLCQLRLGLLAFGRGSPSRMRRGTRPCPQPLLLFFETTKVPGLSRVHYLLDNPAPYCGVSERVSHFESAHARQDCFGCLPNGSHLVVIEYVHALFRAQKFNIHPFKPYSPSQNLGSELCYVLWQTRCTLIQIETIINRDVFHHAWIAHSLLHEAFAVALTRHSFWPLRTAGRTLTACILELI